MENQNSKFTFKELLSILKKCSSANMGKGVVAILLYSVLQGIVYFISLFPSLVTTSAGTGLSLSTASLSLVLFACGNIVCCVLLFGLMMIFTRMIELKHVTIGYLFIGFKKDKRVLITAIIYTALLMLAAVLATLIVMLTSRYPVSGNAENPQNLITSFIPLLLIYFGFIILLILPFIFVYFFIYVDPELKVRKAFTLSARLLVKNFFRFIAFELSAGGIWLVVCIAGNALSILVSAGTSTALVSVSPIINLVNVVTQYVALVRIYMAVPLFFFERIGAIKKGEAEEEEKLELLEEMADDLK